VLQAVLVHLQQTNRQFASRTDAVTDAVKPQQFTTIMQIVTNTTNHWQ
jgi:hypothetical protein